MERLFEGNETMIRRILCILLAVATLLVLLPVMAMASEETAESANPPYAQIEYDYSAEVQCGTIRFVNQIVSGPLFRADYWQEWEWKRISGIYYGPGSECGTACMSMALSYVGVNKTPNDILDYGGGYTYFKDWGDAAVCKLPVSDFYAAMENYINGNGRYSPPVIHLPNYSNRGHYVVVIGKIDEETYEILDPNNCAVTSMTITGSSAKYVKNGYTIHDRIDQLTQWFNPNAAPALIKSVYPAACVVKTTEEIYAMSLPCGAERNADSKTLLMLKKDQTLHTAELILNDWDEYWYKIQPLDNAIYYVPASKVEYQQDDPAQVTISNVASPTFLEAGDYFSLGGKITSGNSRLTAVAVYVRKGRGTGGEVITSGSAELNGNTYNLAYSSLDSQVRFGKLTAGEYTYIIEVQYANFYAKGDAIESNVETVILHEAPFTVEAPKDQDPPEKPVLEITIEKDQVRFSWDEVAHTTHYHLLLQKKNADGAWEELERIKYLSSGLERTLDIGEYRAQLIAYNENAWDNQSDDWHHTASDEMDFAIECEHVYADGVVTQEATCKEAGIISYTCTLCGTVKEEQMAQLTTHTPGPSATATENQVCLICDAVLQEATGVTEPTETGEIDVATQPSEPVEQAQKEDALNIGATLALIILSGVGVCATFFEKKYATKKQQEAPETEEPEKTQEMQETQS